MKTRKLLIVALAMLLPAVAQAQFLDRQQQAAQQETILLRKYEAYLDRLHGGEIPHGYTEAWWPAWRQWCWEHGNREKAKKLEATGWKEPNAKKRKSHG